MLARYSNLLSAPEDRRLALTAAAGRLAIAMMPLALILAVAKATSFGVAGLAASALALGSAAGGPVQGRLVDRHGQKKVLWAAIAVSIAALVALYLTTATKHASGIYIALAALLGAAQPPLTACMRIYWEDRHSQAELRHAGQAFESFVNKGAAFLGPLLVSFVIAGSSRPAVFLAIAALLTVGTGLYLWLRHRDPSVPAPVFPAVGAPKGVFTLPLCCALAAAAVTGWALGCLELAIPAFADKEGAINASGPLLSVAAFGAVVGAFVYGIRRSDHDPGRLVAVFCVAYGVTLAPLSAAGSIAGLALGLVVAGAANAWLGTAINQRITELCPRESRTEALSWYLTAVALGLAAAQGLGGLALSSLGVAGLMLAAALAPLLCGLVLLSARRAGVDV